MRDARARDARAAVVGGGVASGRGARRRANVGAQSKRMVRGRVGRHQSHQGVARGRELECARREQRGRVDRFRKQFRRVGFPRRAFSVGIARSRGGRGGSEHGARSIRGDDDGARWLAR